MIKKNMKLFRERDKMYLKAMRMPSKKKESTIFK